jgi:hypothetical protein
MSQQVALPARTRQGGEIESSPRDDDVAPSIHRVSCDALGVAREMRAVGLPEELAETLVAAA